MKNSKIFRLVSFILIIFLFIILSSCNLAKLGNEINNSENDLLVGVNFNFVIDYFKDEVINNNDEYFKLYILDDLVEKSSQIYFNKGFINVNYSNEIEILNDKSVINNKVYAEVLLNKKMIVYNDGLYLNKEGSIYTGDGSYGVLLNFGSIHIINFDVSGYQLDGVTINNSFEFKFEISNDNLVEIEVHEFNNQDELIKMKLINENQDQDYYPHEDFSYIIIMEKYLSSSKEIFYKRHLVNKAEIENDYYFYLKFFNEQGFVEGNHIRFII